MFIINWTDALNFFGGMLALFLATAQLLLVKKNHRNYVLALTFISGSLFTFCINFHFFTGMDNWYETAPFVLAFSVFFVSAL